jgi:hypothetical protein
MILRGHFLFDPLLKSLAYHYECTNMTENHGPSKYREERICYLLGYGKI